jgi:hypothetical protein
MTPRFLLCCVLLLLPACSMVPEHPDALQTPAGPADSPPAEEPLPLEAVPPLPGARFGLETSSESAIEERTSPEEIDCPAAPCWPPRLEMGWRDRCRAAPYALWEGTCDYLWATWYDQWNYYALDNLALLALGVGVVAPLANSAADQEIRDWYQERVRCRGLDQVSEWAKAAGDHFYVIPIYVGAACIGKVFEDNPAGSCLNTWATRTTRAALVGAPTVGILQYTLGASRPVEGSSHWRLFGDVNGVAGHGFIGALPFLSAASMTDNPWLRYPLLAGSLATNWSRINDDAHYFSQALLGWWIAYLSMRSVTATDRERAAIQFLPCSGTDAPGVSVLVSY